MASGSIDVTECVTTRPSPLARKMTWGQLNQYMYAGDELPSDRRSRLRGELIREVVRSPWLRPPVSAETIERFEEKRQRLSPGYAPSPDRDLVDWLKERVVLPWPDWEKLMAAVARDRRTEREEAERRAKAGGTTARTRRRARSRAGGRGPARPDHGQRRRGPLRLRPRASARGPEGVLAGTGNRRHDDRRRAPSTPRCWKRRTARRSRAMTSPTRC